MHCFHLSFNNFQSHHKSPIEGEPIRLLSYCFAPSIVVEPRKMGMLS
jgi:hypothetical protein